MASLLLVDDSHLIGVVITRIFSGMDVEVVHIRVIDDLFGFKGRRALIRELEPDAILLDLNMPGMDGISVLRKFKSMTRLESVPVVMISSTVSGRVMEEMETNGAADFVRKPLEPKKVLFALARACPNSNPIGRMLEKMKKEALVEPNGFKLAKTGASAKAGRKKPLNLDHLLDLLGGDRELLQEIVDVFIQDAPGQLEDINAAIKKGENENLRILAHDFKGSVANFNQEHITNEALLLERMGKEGHINKAQPVLDTLKSHVEELIEQLKEETAQA